MQVTFNAHLLRETYNCVLAGLSPAVVLVRSWSTHFTDEETEWFPFGLTAGRGVTLE